MLGDTAVGFHPDDEPTQLIGPASMPLSGPRIPIIPTSIRPKGTGAVNDHPAHDFNDFEVGGGTIAADNC